MSEVEAVAVSPDDARRLTERIRLIAQNVADNVEKLRELVSQARESSVHEVLGYASWTAYLKDVFGDEPLRLARDVRQELVAELAAQGMSTRAIAPIVGVGHKTIARDLTPPVSNDTPVQVVNAATGEVLEAVTEVTETHTLKTVTGLDGKNYKVPKPQPKPRTESQEVAIVNDIRLYLRNIAHSRDIQRLSPGSKQHIIDALNNTIKELQRSES